MSLAKNLTANRIRQWAGPQSFGRGEDYFDEDRVRGLKENQGKITATVSGTYPYKIALWEDGDTVDYDCDCPVGLRGDFCKHCVATALAWLKKETPSGKTNARKGKKPKKADAGLTIKDVHAWLLLQKKETLADMLVEAAVDDEQLSNRLMLKAAAAKGVDLATYKKVIDQAIGGDEYIDYHHMYDYWRGMDEAMDAVEELFHQSHWHAVIELSEYALSRAERAIEHVDDSDGYMGMLLERLQALHLAACRKARPDPKTLAERLFKWELHGEWDTFFNAVQTYSRVLGKQGRERYQELAKAEWAKIKPLKPGQDDLDEYSQRFRITNIMENLAEQSGDIESLVEIKQRNLSSSYHYLQIAAIYSKARHSDQALEWAEKGIQIFADKVDSRLQDFLADLYHRRKRHDEAMALIWPQFKQHPGLENYQKLKKNADHGKDWPRWRERALKHLRAVINKKAQSKPRDLWHYRTSLDHSSLVEIFLWEKDNETAWQEAQAGGCDESLWLKLAGLREKNHPRDAIAVYQKRIGPIVDRTDNNAYAEAAGLLRRVDKLMNKLGEKTKFKQYLASIRTEYKRKRNFMKLLEKFS